MRFHLYYRGCQILVIQRPQQRAPRACVALAPGSGLTHLVSGFLRCPFLKRRRKLQPEKDIHREILPHHHIDMTPFPKHPVRKDYAGFLKDIPDAVRWRSAAGCAATLPALYDVAFREALGEKYDALEQEILDGVPVCFQDVVHDCSLPARNAQEIARSFRSRPSSSSGRPRG